MKNPELYWKSASGDIKVADMDTGHLVNTVKLINKMAYRVNNRNEDFEYPECYDNMYKELENRGVDTDFEMDYFFKSLEESE